MARSPKVITRRAGCTIRESSTFYLSHGPAMGREKELAPDSCPEKGTESRS